MTTKSMTKQFSQSFNEIIEPKKLKQYDQWIMIVEKTVNLILTFIGILIAALSLYLGTTISLPLLLTVGFALLGFAVSSLIGIGYRFYIAKDSVYGRIQLVVLALLAILFGIPMTLILSTLMWVMRTFNDLLLLIAVIGLVLSLGIFYKITQQLDKSLRNFINRKIDSLLIDPIKPFNEIFHNIFTYDFLRVRLLATGVCMLYVFVIWITLFPNAIEFGMLIVYFLGSGYFLKRKHYLQHMVNYRSSTEVVGVVQYCAQIAYNILSFGLKTYEVKFNTSSFDKSHTPVYSTIIRPEKHDQILVLHSVLTSVDIAKIRKHLKEKWSNKPVRVPLGPIEIPFRDFDGRILIDEHVWNSEKILWTGTDIRLAIVVEGAELRKTKYENGSFSKLTILQEYDDD